MTAFSIIGFRPDFMLNLTGFLFFCVIVIAVFMMNRFLRFDDKIIYPGTREELAEKEAAGKSGKHEE